MSNQKVMRYSQMSMKLLHRQATIQEHAMEYQNVQRLCLNVVRCHGRGIRSSGKKNENDGPRRKCNLLVLGGRTGEWDQNQESL